jgi:hypothetical protein
MANTILKIVKVFIGSPGGLDDERHLARRIVEEINQSHSENWGCQIKLVGWELTLPGYSRAQSLINEELDTCEYFVGVIWNKWGSKPDDGDSRFTSGFEEEFERARSRVENGEMKDIALFFKKIPDVQADDLGPSVSRVVAFKNECIERRKPLFKEFERTDDFGSLFRAIIEKIGWREARGASLAMLDAGDQAGSDNADADKPNALDPQERLIAPSASGFVMELLQRPVDWSATSAVEIARLRLIAASASRSGNDELYLGNHDANLLFAQRDSIAFSVQEIRALLDSGVAAFSHRGAPLWHWLSATSSGQNRLDVLAAFGNAHEKANALRILRLINGSIPTFTDDPFDHDYVVASWLVGDRAHTEIDAALDFLIANSSSGSIAAVEKVVEKVEPRIKSKVSSALISMLSVDSRASALSRMIELDPDALPEAAISKMFASPASIDTPTLVKCLLLKADVVRWRAAQILLDRGIMDGETAQRLFSDSDIRVRLVASKALFSLHQHPDDSTIRKALTQRPQGLLGIGFNPGQRDDDYYYDVYRIFTLSKLGYADLSDIVAKTSIYDIVQVLAFYESNFNRSKKDLSRNLIDSFEQHFEKRFDRIANLFAPDTKLVADAKDLGPFLRRRLITGALDIICRKGSRSDLETVRAALDRNKLEYLDSALKYLARFGEWSDVERVLSFVDRYLRYESRFEPSSEDRANLIGFTLYQIGKRRVADLLLLKMTAAVRGGVFLAMSKIDFCSLEDADLMSELNNENSSLREIVALLCVRHLSQARVKRLLQSYVNRDEYRYYNSIHWLDLGASMISQVARVAVSRQLAVLS